MSEPVNIRWRARSLLLAGLWCLLALTGCEEDVTAVLGTAQPYSLYGVLTPEADTQWVRVFTVEGQLEPPPRRLLDAHFTSTNRQTGETVVWQDSLIRDLNDVTSHVFWAPLRAEHDHTYDLAVRRSDGKASSVEVTIPSASELEVLPAEIGNGYATVPVRVTAPVPRLLRTEVVYSLSFAFSREVEGHNIGLRVHYTGREVQQADGWLIPLDLAQDFIGIRQFLSQFGTLNSLYGIRLGDVRMRAIAATSDWYPPEGVFDASVLVEPGTMTNVRNGFGFVGGGYRLEKRWAPDTTAVRAAGFKLVNQEN